MTKDDDLAALAARLTEKQRKFAVNISGGMTNKDAYADAYSVVRMKENSMYSEASKLRSNPKVATYIRALLRTKTVEDMVTVGEIQRLLMDTIERCLADDGPNYSAGAAMLDRLMRSRSMLSDRLINTTPEGTLSDGQLIEALCVGRPELREQLEQVLGNKSGFTH